MPSSRHTDDTEPGPPPALTPPAGTPVVQGWLLASRLWHRHRPQPGRDRCPGCDAPAPCATFTMAERFLSDLRPEGPATRTRTARTPVDASPPEPTSPVNGRPPSIRFPPGLYHSSAADRARAAEAAEEAAGAVPEALLPADYLRQEPAPVTGPYLPADATVEVPIAYQRLQQPHYPAQRGSARLRAGDPAGR